MTEKKGTNGKREYGARKRVPTEKPKFTEATLHKAIPEHCFKPSVVTSFAYLIRDLVVMAAMYYASLYIEGAPVPTWVKWGVLWPSYWFWQGTMALGVWVIAHDCGHEAFSEYPLLNDCVGLALHSLLLVPYFSWKISHRKHHAHTNSTSKDEVFIPDVREEVSDKFEFDQLAAVRAAKLALTLVAGWPLYLLFNVAGRPYPRFANHFFPWSPIYSKHEHKQIIISDVALAVVWYGAIQLAQVYGWSWLLCSYLMPLVFTNVGLVLIPMLQHTHPDLPNYTEKEWDWLRGNLATVDRDYGVFNKLTHRIADTHVLHHLFPTIPHYHAPEASEAIKPVLGEYYRSDDRPILRAMWDDYAVTRYVAPDEKGGQILWYRK